MQTLNLRLLNTTFVKLLFTCIVYWLLTPLVTLYGQTDKTPARGFHPAGSYALSDLETISTTNGNLTMHIPLASLPAGRGGLTHGLTLNYNSKSFDHYTSVGADPFNNNNPVNQDRLRFSDEAGWAYSFGYELQVIDRYLTYPSTNTPQCPNVLAKYRYKVKIRFPDGSLHEFRPLGSSNYDNQDWFNVRPDGWVEECPSGAMGSPPTYYSVDSTYMRFKLEPIPGGGGASSWTLYLPDGGRVTSNEGNSGVQRIYDRNGNYIEILSVADYQSTGHPADLIVDQLGRSLVIEHNYSANEDYVHSKGFNNQTLTWTVKWSGSFWLRKKYKAVETGSPYEGYFGSPFYEEVYGSIPVIEQIVLPAQAGTGLRYNFTYNSNSSWPEFSEDWGELESISLPDGVRSSGATSQAKAIYTYRWDGFPANEYLHVNEVLNNTPIKKELTYWREYDGQASQTTETWLYDINPQSGVSYITEPSGGQIKEEFTHSDSFLIWNAGLVHRTTQADGSVVERLWQQNVPQGITPPLPPTGWHTGLNTYVKTEFRSIRHSPTDIVPALTAIKDYNYDKNGNLTQVAEYDWVSYGDVQRSNGLPTGVIPAGAQVKRVIANTYYNPTPAASNTAGDHSNAYHLVTGTRWLRALESSETRSDLSLFTALARSEYIYEDYSTKGNVKEERSWDSTKGAISRPLTTENSLAVKNEYGTWPSGASGKLLWTDDARKNAGNSGDSGSRTEYVYGDIDGLGHSELYPTQVLVASNVAAVKRTTNTKYDFQTGLVTEATDADNNSTTKTTYDIFGRPTLVEEGVFNNNALRKTTTSYSDTERRTITRSDLNAVGDGLLISIQHYDQLGRLRLARTLENGNINEATVETTGIKVQTRYLYDTANQRSLEITSAPYRAATSSAATNEVGMGWRCSLFDKTGRLTEVETFTGVTLPAPLGNNTNSTGKILTSYDAELVLVTDQAGKNRRSGIDALGRLVKVWEAPTTTGMNYETNYTYNALDSLTTVEQGAQTRTFNYDSLKRLTSATNPESGMVSYSYDANGNLLTKTDARKWVTRYTYDALNRNTTVDYSNTLIKPDITRIYDNPANGKGLLWKEYANGNEEQGANVEYREIGSYDKLGRPLSVSQKAKFNNTWTAPYTTVQTYNPAGQVIGMTYPSTRTVSYGYDSAGRLTSFSGNLGGNAYTYATGLTYNARGQLRREQFGTTSALYHRMYYNARGQMTDARLGTGNSTDFDAETPLTGTAAWGSWDRGALRWEYGGTTTNNGNVTRQEHLIPQSSPNLAYNVQLYSYDALNRLTSVEEKTGTHSAGGNSDGAATFKQAFAYDRWGNRTIDLPNSSLQSQVPWLNLKQYKVNAATNRLAAFDDADGDAKDAADRMKYDEAGNLIFDSWTDSTTSVVAGKRTYDAENRLVKAVGGVGGGSNKSHSYTYDAGGRRTRRVINTGTETETWWQVYGVGGELVAEYKLVNNAPMLQKEYGYRNGQLLVVYDATETGDKQWQWLVTDALGTPRMVVDRSGTLAGIKRHDYLPFGEELYVGAGTLRTTGNGYPVVADKVRQKFTSKERDGETGLDYFLARYYSSVQGRFTSPDEFTGGPDELYDFADLASSNPTFYADLTDPQSLNKYQYCYNNPLAYTDPDGHKGLREWAKQAVQVAADFTVGVSQGVVASISYGVCSLCQASANDSLSRRAGQVLGTAIVGAQGTTMMGAGGGALVLTGGTLVPAYATAAVGTALAAGAAKNSLVLAATPIRNQGNQAQSGNTPSNQQTQSGQNTTSSDYTNITKGSSVHNRKTDVARSEFEQNLANDGWTKTVRGNGKVVEYSKNGARYVVRDNAKSTGGSAADYYKAGSKEIDLKIRLQ